MIKLEPYDIIHSKKLSLIMSGDIVLRDALGNSFNGSATDFHHGTMSWISKTNSKSFSIVLNGTPVGLISLSHVDFTEHVARIGYWLSSKYWNLGYMKVAFEQVLFCAQKLDLTSVSATISNDNTASIRLWKKYNAVKEICNEHKSRYTVELPINAMHTNGNSSTLHSRR